jgi:hypothetical protein
MNYVLKTKDSLNEWNVILIYYVLDFLNLKTIVIIKKKSFVIFFMSYTIVI